MALKARRPKVLPIFPTLQTSPAATPHFVSTLLLHSKPRALTFPSSASDQNNKTRSSNTAERKQSSAENDIFDATFGGQSKLGLDRLTCQSPIKLENSTVVIVDLISKIARFGCVNCSHTFKSKALFADFFRGRNQRSREQ